MKSVVKILLRKTTFVGIVVQECTPVRGQWAQTACLPCRRLPTRTAADWQYALRDCNRLLACVAVPLRQQDFFDLLKFLFDRGDRGIR